MCLSVFVLSVGVRVSEERERHREKETIDELGRQVGQSETGMKRLLEEGERDSQRAKRISELKCAIVL